MFCIVRQTGTPRRVLKMLWPCCGTVYVKCLFLKPHDTLPSSETEPVVCSYLRSYTAASWDDSFKCLSLAQNGNMLALADSSAAKH